MRLRDIGLTDGEAKVYLALSLLGSSTVGPVVKKARVAYSNVYEILDRLMEKGIVSYIVRGKRRHFQAAAPRNLLEYLDQREAVLHAQREALRAALPQFEELQRAARESEAEIFVGKRALRTAYQKLLGGGKQYNFFYIHDETYARDADLFYLSIIDILEKVPARGIANKYSRKSQFLKSKTSIETRFVSFPIPGNIDVCGERILILSWEGSPTGVLIHSAQVAQNFLAYFEKVWDRGKK
jgi:predicted transcriptional regulator